MARGFEAGANQVVKADKPKSAEPSKTNAAKKSPKK
jgi:hypothetical protein